jgi:hypothetical protein
VDFDPQHFRTSKRKAPALQRLEVDGFSTAGTVAVGWMQYLLKVSTSTAISTASSV